MTRANASMSPLKLQAAALLALVASCCCISPAEATTGVIGLHIAAEIVIMLCIVAFVAAFITFVCYTTRSCCFKRRARARELHEMVNNSNSAHCGMTANPLAASYRKSASNESKKSSSMVNNSSSVQRGMTANSLAASYRKSASNESKEGSPTPDKAQLYEEVDLENGADSDDSDGGAYDNIPDIPRKTSAGDMHERPPVPLPRSSSPMIRPLPPRPYTGSRSASSSSTATATTTIPYTPSIDKNIPARSSPAAAVPREPFSLERSYVEPGTQEPEHQQRTSAPSPPTTEQAEYVDMNVKRKRVPKRTGQTSGPSPQEPAPGQHLKLSSGEDLEAWSKETVSLWLRAIGVGLVPGLKGLSGRDLAGISEDDLLLLGVHGAKTQQIIISSRDALLPTLASNSGDDDNETVVDIDMDEDDTYVAQDELQPPSQYMLHKVQSQDSPRRDPYENVDPLPGTVYNEELHKLLSSANLSPQYLAIFAHEGIDDVGILCEYTANELKDLGMKGGHAKRLLSEARAFNPRYRTNASRMAHELQESERKLREHVERLSTVQLDKFKPDGRPWEVDRDTVFEGKLLGEGGFGKVYFGTASNLLPDEEETLMAIKMLKMEATELDKRDFLDEIHVMQRFQPHRNLVNLLGFCVRDEPMMLLLEYMKDGDLLTFLRSNRPTEEEPEPKIKASELLGFMADIAAGMAFISSRHCVHRDLAARNVLLDRPRAAVADFGLARRMTEQYAYLIQNKQRALPTRWLAPESLLYQKFTTQTDVWAFGVTMWEIAMMGAIPYPGLPTTQLFQLLLRGHRMDKPQHCSDALYQLMLECWSKLPSKRPSFAELEKRLRTLQARASYHLDDTQEGSKEYMSLDIVDDEDDEWLPTMETLAEEPETSAVPQAGAGKLLQRAPAMDHSLSRRLSVSEALRAAAAADGEPGQNGSEDGNDEGEIGHRVPFMEQQASYAFHMSKDPSLQRGSSQRRTKYRPLSRQGSRYHRLRSRPDGSMEIALDGEEKQGNGVGGGRGDEGAPRKKHAYDDVKPRSESTSANPLQERRPSLDEEEELYENEDLQDSSAASAVAAGAAAVRGRQEGEGDGYDKLEGAGPLPPATEELYENDGSGAMKKPIRRQPALDNHEHAQPKQPQQPLPPPTQPSPSPPPPPREQQQQHEHEHEPVEDEVATDFGAPLLPAAAPATQAATQPTDVYITTDEAKSWNAAVDQQAPDTEPKAQEAEQGAHANAGAGEVQPAQQKQAYSEVILDMKKNKVHGSAENVQTDQPLESMDLDAVADAAATSPDHGGNGSHDDDDDDDNRRFAPDAQPVYLDFDDEPPARPEAEETIYESVVKSNPARNQPAAPTATNTSSQQQRAGEDGTWQQAADALQYLEQRPGVPEVHGLPKDAGYLEEHGNAEDVEKHDNAKDMDYEDAKEVVGDDVDMAQKAAKEYLQVRAQQDMGINARGPLRRSRREEKRDPPSPSHAVAAEGSTPPAAPQAAPAAALPTLAPPAEAPPARPPQRRPASSRAASGLPQRQKRSEARPTHRRPASLQPQAPRSSPYAGKDEDKPYSQLPPPARQKGRQKGRLPQRMAARARQPDDNDEGPTPPRPPKPSHLQPPPDATHAPGHGDGAVPPPLPKKGVRRR